MGRGEIVYLDIVFIINFIMDYVILWTTAKFAQAKSVATRLLAGAVTGALFSMLIFYLLYMVPGSLDTFKLFVLKVVVSVIMVMVAFPRQGVKKFLNIMMNLYLVAFAMGGAMLGSIYLFQNNPAAYTTMNGLVIFLVNVRYTWLVAALAVAVLVGRWGRTFVRRNILRSMLRVPVVVRFGNRRLALNALVDTGNNLRDPLTYKPVIIAEYKALQKVLPQSLRAAFETENSSLDEIVKALEKDASWGFRVRLIPFSSIGKSRGMLLGLRPDDVIVVTDERLIKVKDVVVAICDRRLSPKGEYKALLHPDLLEVA